MAGQIPLVVVCGPTASGKTALAAELGLRLGGEVICADSMQIYKGMNIATAKPTAEEMRGVPHHLVDFVEPENAAFSVADYARLAREAILDVNRRGRLPILAGGTGLYIRAVTDHINYDGFSGDKKIRARLEREAEQEGGQRLWERLAAVDPALAGTLHPNNLGRVLRALEVYEATGLPMSEHQRRSRQEENPYRLCMLGLDFSHRALLYERIERRVDRMLSMGLLEEARLYCAPGKGTAGQAIGYKELAPYFRGEAALEDCICRLKTATRRYAKRQLTWFKRDERIAWLMADGFKDFGELSGRAENLIHKSGILCYTENDSKSLSNN